MNAAVANHSGSVSIERADQSDLDGILKLAEDNYADRGGQLTGTLARNAVAATIQMVPAVVAKREGRVVGFLLTWEKTFSKHPCVAAMLEAYPGSTDAYVYGPICVDASMRGRGLAGAMFKRLVELLPGREGVLFIKADNTASIRAHERMGIEQTTEFTYQGKRFLVLAYRT